MAHAEHFLTRLDRVAGAELDLALELYRDPELVQALLGAASLPDGAARVAVSLDDDTAGPFVLVTRDGAFVTCLGRDMRPGDLPIVTRPALDACARRVSRAREKLDLARQVTAGDRKASQMLRRLFVAPASLAREDFVEIAKFEPLFGAAFLDTYLAMGCDLLEQGRVLHRVRGADTDEALHAYWSLLHATGHMALLGAMTSERDRYASRTDAHAGSRAALSHPLTSTGIVTFIVKGAWAAGRMGKLVLAEYKRSLAEDVAFFELLDTVFALLAIGTRTRALKAEIQKALRAAPGRATTPQAARLRHAMGHEIELCCEVTAQLLDAAPDELEEGLVKLGSNWFEGAQGHPDDPEWRDLARTLPLMSRTDGLTDGRRLVNTLPLIAASARGGPEQFYLPRALMAELREPWTPAQTRQVLEPMMKVERARSAPVVRRVVVGRNELCPCGSGRKSKKCCGA